MRKQTAMLFGKIASNKFSSVRTKHCLIVNTKENRDRELERLTELASYSCELSSTSISSSDSSSDSLQGVSVSVEIIPPKKRQRKVLLQRISPIAKKRARIAKLQPMKRGEE